MISELYGNLLTKFSTAENLSGDNERRAMRFEGLSSYIRCTAHVLNLIVGVILSALKAGDIQSANRAVMISEPIRTLILTYLLWLDCA
ncbi:hypothetical protein V1505DRAFT_381180 [Lipomyces doorenjongii]